MDANTTYKKILSFLQEEKTLNVRRLRSLTLANKFTPFKIWGETLEGDTYEGREVWTFNGPSRNPGVGYNYNADGYMIMFDANKGDYRTFVYDLITKIEINGQTFKII